MQFSTPNRSFRISANSTGHMTRNGKTITKWQPRGDGQAWDVLERIEFPTISEAKRCMGSAPFKSNKA